MSIIIILVGGTGEYYLMPTFFYSTTMLATIAYFLYHLPRSVIGIWAWCKGYPLKYRAWMFQGRGITTILFLGVHLVNFMTWIDYIEAQNKILTESNLTPADTSSTATLVSATPTVIAFMVTVFIYEGFEIYFTLCMGSFYKDSKKKKIYEVQPHL